MTELESTYHTIKEFLPADTYVIIENVYKPDGEAWQCQVYPEYKSPMESMFMVFAHDGCRTAEDLIAMAKVKYADYSRTKPTNEEKIKQLEDQIAKLRGEA